MAFDDKNVAVDNGGFDEGGDSGYTAEDIAAIRAANGVVDDDAAGADDVDVADVSTDDDNPWSWAEGHDPSKIRKTWEKFTDEWGKLAEEKKQYEPFKELANEIQSDPALQALIRQYFEKGAGEAPDAQLLAMKEQMDKMQRDMSIKEELVGLKEYIATEKLPDVDEREVLEYAAENNSPNLRSAYRDMMFDKIKDSTREQTFDEVRKTKGAAIPSINNGTKVATGLTQKEIDNMDNDEFTKRYAEIQEFYSKQG